MPLVSEFFGIKIYFYFFNHAPPHFHVVVGSSKCKIRIPDSKLLSGEIDPAKRKLIKKKWVGLRGKGNNKSLGYG